MVYEQTYTEDGETFTVRMTPEEQPGLAGSSIKERDQALENFISRNALARGLFEHGYTGKDNTQAAMYAVPPHLSAGAVRRLAQIAQRYNMNDGVLYGKHSRWTVLVAAARGDNSNRDGFLRAIANLDGVMGAWAVTVEVVPPVA